MDVENVGHVCLCLSFVRCQSQKKCSTVATPPRLRQSVRAIPIWISLTWPWVGLSKPILNCDESGRLSWGSLHKRWLIGIHPWQQHSGRT